MLSGTYGPWFCHGRQISLRLLSQNWLGSHLFTSICISFFYSSFLSFALMVKSSNKPVRSTT